MDNNVRELAVELQDRSFLANVLHGDHQLDYETDVDKSKRLLHRRGTSSNDGLFEY